MIRISKKNRFRQYFYTELLRLLHKQIFWCVQGVEKWNTGWKWVKYRNTKCKKTFEKMFELQFHLFNNLCKGKDVERHILLRFCLCNASSKSKSWPKTCNFSQFCDNNSNQTVQHQIVIALTLKINIKNISEGFFLIPCSPGLNKNKLERVFFPLNNIARL